MILGLDASTTVCGWALYNNIEIVDAGFIDISKFDSNKDKAFEIIRVVGSNPFSSQISSVRLEAALSGFMRGRTSQQVVIKLTRFNAILEYILGEHWKIPVHLISANTARKKVLGKAFIKGMTAKEYVKENLPKKLPYIEKFYKLNTKGNWDKKNEDLLDAVIIALS